MAAPVERVWEASTEAERRWAWARAALLAAAAGYALAACLLDARYVFLATGVGLIVVLTLGRPVVGVCVLPFTVAWTGGFALPVGGFPVTLTDVVVACLAIAWFVSLTRDPAPVRLGPWFRYLAAFLAAIVLSATQALNTHASLSEIVKWTESAVVYIAAVRLVRTPRQLAAVISAIVLAGVSQAILGYVQFLFQLGPAAFRHGRFLRAYGTFDQPNPYAGFLNMTMPFALAGVISVRTVSRRNWSGVALILIFGALVISESRGALIGGLLAGAFVLSRVWNRAAIGMRLGVLAGLLFALTANLGLVPLGPFQRLLTAVGLGDVSFNNVNDANFSAVERAAHWVAGVRIFAAHPLVGVGIGNYQFAYPAYHPRGWYAPLAHAHDYYINIAAEAGIVGLVTYLLLAGFALWYSYAAKDRVSSDLGRVAVLGAFGALIATNIHNLFDVLYVHGMATLLGLLVALVSVAVRLERTEITTGDDMRQST